MASSIDLDQTAPTILVVEDEFLIRFMVSDALRDAGFAVIEACDADEALALQLHFRFEVGAPGGGLVCPSPA